MPDELLLALAVGGRDLEPVLARLREDRDETGVDELAHALDDEMQQPAGSMSLSIAAVISSRDSSWFAQARLDS